MKKKFVLTENFKKNRIIILSAAILMFFPGAFATANDASDGSAVFAVTRASELVEGAFKALYGGSKNFSSRAPDVVVPQLLPLLSSATFDEDEYEPEAVVLRKKIKYVQGRASGPWQVVLIPLNEENEIRVEGYGDNVSTPLYLGAVKLFSLE